MWRWERLGRLVVDCDEAGVEDEKRSRSEMYEVEL